MASRRARIASVALVLAFMDACDDAGPERKSCEEAFADWPCARNMCLACEEVGGEMRVLESSPPRLNCWDADGMSLIPEGDICEAPYCDDVSTEPLGDAAAAQFLAPIAGEHTSTLTWFREGTPGLEHTEPSAGAQTELTVRVELRGAVEAVHSEPVTPQTEGVPDIPGAMIRCGDTLGVDASITFTTADGIFAQTFDTRIFTTVAVDGTPVDAPADPGAELELESLPPGVILTPAKMIIHEDLGAAIRFSPAGPSGGITLSLVQGDEGDIGVMPTSFPVATW